MDFKFKFMRELPHNEDMNNGIVYVSEEFGVAKHLCACGCGELTVTPLKTIGNITGWDKTGWDLIKEKDGTNTLNPSIGNFQIDCKSHYFIRKNKVVWCR